MIEEGAKAPDFTLPSQDGDEVSLSDSAGRAGRSYGMSGGFTLPG